MTLNSYWYYFYSGLRVASEMEIPEWVFYCSSESFDNPDVCIRIDEALPPTELDDHQPVIIPDEVRFTVGETGTYAIRKGQEILLNPHPTASPRELRLFLLGTAWGVLCYQRGLLVLHASVVRVGDGAVAFSSPAGMGKSTLAAALIRSGYALVGDDLSRFTVDEQGQAQVFPSSTRLKLWDDALGYLDWRDQPLERDHFRLDKYHLQWEGAKQTAILPLRAFYLLAWGELNLARVTGLRSLQGLIEHATYRGSFLKPMNLLPTYWEKCRELRQSVPVYQLQRPKDLDRMDETIQLLEKHWSKMQVIPPPKKQNKLK